MTAQYGIQRRHETTGQTLRIASRPVHGHAVRLMRELNVTAKAKARRVRYSIVKERS